MQYPYGKYGYDHSQVLIESLRVPFGSRTSPVWNPWVHLAFMWLPYTCIIIKSLNVYMYTTNVVTWYISDEIYFTEVSCLIWYIINNTKNSEYFAYQAISEFPLILTNSTNNELSAWAACIYIPEASRVLGFNWSYGSHYGDVIMGVITSQITSLAIVYSIVYSNADQRKHQNSVSLAFLRGIHRGRWIPRTNGQ